MSRAVLVVALLLLVGCGRGAGESQPRDAPPAAAPRAAAPLAEAPLAEAPLAEARRTFLVQHERYGTLGADHPITKRVRSVFAKLERVAGRRPGLVTEVSVLDTPKIVGESLRGGLVVVSRGLVDLARSDDALAFLLAHELAHEVRDHHGLLTSLGVLGARLTPGATSVPPDQVVRAYHAVELDADRLGVLFTALAGYQTSSAFPALQQIIERLGPDLFHPDQKARGAAIRAQLDEVVDNFEVFPLGLFLLSTGRYLEAAHVLEQFLSTFPSREVMSAVGVAFHKDGLRYAPIPEFRHLLAIDAATRAPIRRGGPDPLFRQRLERAIYYYALAVDADPAYAPALNNLGTAYLDLGERELALGYISRALKEDPSLASAYNNRAIAACLTKDYKRAEDDFLTAARLAPGSRDVTANLARLYELMGRGDDARRWAQASDRGATPKPPGSDVSGPLVPGQPASLLTEWRREPGARQIDLPQDPGADGELALFVFSRHGLAALVRNGRIDTVGILPDAKATTVRGVRPGDPMARVLAAYGPAEGLDGIHALGIWAFPSRALAFFVVNDHVEAIWAGRAAQPTR